MPKDITVIIKLKLIEQFRDFMVTFIKINKLV